MVQKFSKLLFEFPLLSLRAGMQKLAIDEFLQKFCKSYELVCDVGEHI
ncbi:Putative hypothetical protein [Helicobacter mustelae 12198]|uniref:Uncharacterized protein n=1 Tax=Helicobacter mustelae (strain ATCC 43772 / CCUG 25715 / CIP 103759 / LMG 18044 / NCTC 12198 / R85-136P) TaxID=679897 RepID=D3UGJ5_HELM1|nr:Putative hypothetical protein [Helicobacter mustelae 12198]